MVGVKLVVGGADVLGWGVDVAGALVVAGGTVDKGFWGTGGSSVAGAHTAQH